MFGSTRSPSIPGQPSLPWHVVVDHLRIIANVFALLLWSTMIFWLLIEIKQYYNIDLLPGFDTPVDKTQDNLSRLVRDAFQW
jgi:hypothetical protein